MHIQGQNISEADTSNETGWMRIELYLDSNGMIRVPELLTSKSGVRVNFLFY